LDQFETHGSSETSEQAASSVLQHPTEFQIKILVGNSLGFLNKKWKKWLQILTNF